MSDQEKIDEDGIVVLEKTRATEELRVMRAYGENSILEQEALLRIQNLIDAFSVNDRDKWLTIFKKIIGSYVLFEKPINFFFKTRKDCSVQFGYLNIAEFSFESIDKIFGVINQWSFGQVGQPKTFMDSYGIVLNDLPTKVSEEETKRILIMLHHIRMTFPEKRFYLKILANPQQYFTEDGEISEGALLLLDYLEKSGLDLYTDVTIDKYKFFDLLIEEPKRPFPEKEERTLTFEN